MRSAATIVTLDPDAAVFGRIQNISRQVDILYVVDNSQQASELGALAPNITYIHHQNAGGLSGALNRSLRLARAEGFEYLFVFDQDTDVKSDFCSALLNVARRSSSEKMAVFGPMHINSSTGHPVRLSVPRGLLMSQWPRRGGQAIECMFLINSCSLLSLARIPAEEEYDESLPVDMSDVDFCLRLRKRGLISICSPSIQVRHGIGHRKAGSSMFSATNYGAHRKYMQIKARIIVWRRHRAAFFRYVLTDAVIALMDFARTVIFEPDKTEKIHAYRRGILDGIRLSSHR